VFRKKWIEPRDKENWCTLSAAYAIKERWVKRGAGGIEGAGQGRSERGNLPLAPSANWKPVQCVCVCASVCALEERPHNLAKWADRVPFGLPRPPFSLLRRPCTTTPLQANIVIVGATRKWDLRRLAKQCEITTPKNTRRKMWKGKFWKAKITFYNHRYSKYILLNKLVYKTLNYVFF